MSSAAYDADTEQMDVTGGSTTRGSGVAQHDLMPAEAARDAAPVKWIRKQHRGFIYEVLA